VRIGRDYWNAEYVEYWKRRSRDAEAHPLDPKEVPGSAVYEAMIDALEPEYGEVVLDLGIGFGRMVPAFRRRGLGVVGVDVSLQMLRCAVRDFSGKCALLLADGHQLPLRAGSVDLVFCWGTFDTFHDQALGVREMVRVLRPGGRLLVTGKNSSYCPDDQEARIAAEAAARKGHPNFFTDYDGLLQWTADAGARHLKTFFCKYRGDLSQNKTLEHRPDCFYEYVFIAEKNPT
jgi:SAM-dependent methyltransferase